MQSLCKTTPSPPVVCTGNTRAKRTFPDVLYRSRGGLILHVAHGRAKTKIYATKKDTDALSTKKTSTPPTKKPPLSEDSGSSRPGVKGPMMRTDYEAWKKAGSKLPKREQRRTMRESDYAWTAALLSRLEEAEDS